MIYLLHFDNRWMDDIIHAIFCDLPQKNQLLIKNSHISYTLKQ